MTYLDGVSTQIVTNILNGIPNPIYNPIATVNAGELSMIDFHFRTKPDSLVNYALKSGNFNIFVINIQIFENIFTILIKKFKKQLLKHHQSVRLLSVKAVKIYNVSVNI